MEFEDPVTLVRVPRALQENSPHKFGHVFGLLAGRKRKRHEICGAVDGDSVNIYEVSNAKILSSYPVPPAACFTSAPCSLRTKSAKNVFIRTTYCTTKRAVQQIECFTEQLEDDRSLGFLHTVSTIQDTESPVGHIDIIPSSDCGHALCVIHENGLMRLISEGLQKEELVVQLVDTEATSMSVVAFHWNTFEEAQNSILKRRPDILSTTSSEPGFLVVLYRDPSFAEVNFKIGIWTISLESRTFMNTSHARQKPVASHSLLQSNIWSMGSETRCAFSANASTLSISSTRGMVNYDLCAYVPQISWYLRLDQNDLLGAIRLNNSLMMGATTSSLIAYDSKFGSVRASLDLTKIGKKRKRNPPGTANRGPVYLVAYFPQLRRLVGVRGNFLVAFDLKGVDSKGTTKEALLIDSIGRGLPEKDKTKNGVESIKLSFGVVDNLADISNKTWTTIMQRLNDTVTGGDAAEFERIIVQDLGGSNGELLSAHSIGDEKLNFLLSKVFRYVPELAESDGGKIRRGAHIEVAMAAHGLLSWLIRSRLLVRHVLEKALKIQSQTPRKLHIKGGMIAEALMQSDSTFGLMTIYIDNAESLDAAELAASVKLLLTVAIAEAQESTVAKSLLLENADRMDQDQTSNSEHEPTDIATIEMVGQKSGGLADPRASVVRLLISALEILAGYGSSTVSNNLSSTLDQADILALIQFLRQQLFQGGHTMSLVQQSHHNLPSSRRSALEERVSEPVLSLEVISKLLLACIDAMGPLGFFVNGADSDFLQTLVPELKSEIALAMEGVEEVSYLRGIFRETMRYADSASKRTFERASTSLLGSQSVPGQEPGTIITVFSEPSGEQGDIQTTGGMLPLSLRAEDVVSKMKMRKGGGQMKARSLRETREIEHRKKGKYSFERLVL